MKVEFNEDGSIKLPKEWTQRSSTGSSSNTIEGDYVDLPVIFKKDSKVQYNKETDVYFRYYYHPKGSGNYQQQDFSYWLLSALKSGMANPHPDCEVIDKVLYRIKECLSESTEFKIAIMPSHSKGLGKTPFRWIAQKLCGGNIVDYTSLLVRSHDIEVKHKDNTRDFQGEIESLELDTKFNIKDSIILLMDDITTSGTSLNAGKEVLLNAGTKEVYCMAVAKTVRW